MSQQKTLMSTVKIFSGSGSEEVAKIANEFVPLGKGNSASSVMEN